MPSSIVGSGAGCRERNGDAARGVEALLRVSIAAFDDRGDSGARELARAPMDIPPLSESIAAAAGALGGCGADAAVPPMQLRRE